MKSNLILAIIATSLIFITHAEIKEPSLDEMATAGKEGAEDALNAPACLPPGADREVRPAIDPEASPLTKQPKLGCAVILCLASAKSSKGCNPVLKTLYSGRWLGHWKGPRWPVCSDPKIKSDVNIKREKPIEFEQECILKTTTFEASFSDITIFNYKKKKGLPVSKDEEAGDVFFNAAIPYKFSVSTKPPKKHHSCPYVGDTPFVWLASDYRPPAKDHDDELEGQLNTLSNLPTCRTPITSCVDPTDESAVAKNNSLPDEEKLPLCERTCVDPKDKVAVEENAKLPKDEQLPVCGKCDVTSSFLKNVLGKSILFNHRIAKKYPDVYKVSMAKFVPNLNKSMAKYNIKGCYHKAHFIAQTFHESAYYTTPEELASGAAYEGAARLGNTQKGDGKRFKGRGIIQLTGRYNYRMYGFVNKPRQVASVLYNAIDAAGFYWTKLAFAGGPTGCAPRKYRGNINKVINAEPNNVVRVSRCINGGNIGLRDRKNLYNKIKKAWNLK